jgi:hypothetical protein
MDRNEIPHDPHHLGVLLGVSKIIFEPVAPMLHRSTIGVPSGESKTISEPVVCLVQTMHLFFIDTNTVSKRTEMRFHMTHIIKVFNRVCPKWFSSLWYVQRKLCTYLASILTLCPNGPKWDFSRSTSPRCSIGCAQNYFQACGTFGANHATILRQD